MHQTRHVRHFSLQGIAVESRRVLRQMLETFPKCGQVQDSRAL